MDASVYVYRHFDSEDRLLYIGMANHPKRRLVAHGRANWHSSVARSTYERFPSRAAAAMAEKIAIATEHPLWNIIGSRKSLTRPVHPIRIPKKGNKPLTVLEPSENCMAHNGILISMKTGGPANHRETKMANDGSGNRYDYHAIVAWMEWFGYVYEDGSITNCRGDVKINWIDALTLVGSDWQNEFVHRPSIGLFLATMPNRS